MYIYCKKGCFLPKIGHFLVNFPEKFSYTYTYAGYIRKIFLRQSWTKYIGTRSKKRQICSKSEFVPNILSKIV